MPGARAALVLTSVLVASWAVPGQAQAPDVAEAPPVADRALETRLEGIFANVESLADVDVRVQSGVVKLSGETPTREAREDAVELAGKLEGVVYVVDRIEQSGVEERVEPTLERLRGWWRSTVAAAPSLAVALGVVVLFWLLARGVREWDLPFRLFDRRRLVRGVLRQIAGTAVFLLGVVIALELLEATALVGAVLGAAGVVGLAVGFAFRDIAENYLASILLGARRPFAHGDHVVIEGHEGKVMRLTTRETVLMTLDGNHLRLPNALVYKAVILNYTRNPLRQLAFDVGVSVETSLVDAQRLGVETLLETPGVVEDPRPFSRVQSLGDSNVVLRFFAWVDQREADWYKVRSEAIRRVKTAFDAAQIEMPVPIQRVETMPLDAARPTARHRPPDVSPATEETPAHEVNVDRVLERQMAEDTTGDEDLLEGER